jgi:hypothetical protein
MAEMTQLATPTGRSMLPERHNERRRKDTFKKVS